MEDDDEFARPRLVVGNRVEQLFARSFAASRKRRLISVHREWNEYTEWWVGQVHANTEVYRIGSFTSPEQAFAATIRYYYEIATNIQREERMEAERAVIAAAAMAASRVGERVEAAAPASLRKKVKRAARTGVSSEESSSDN
jgi:hypothetical protein